MNLKINKNPQLHVNSSNEHFSIKSLADKKPYLSPDLQKKATDCLKYMGLGLSYSIAIPRLVNEIRHADIILPVPAFFSNAKESYITIRSFLPRAVPHIGLAINHLVFRAGLQEGFLRKLPKAMLQRRVSKEKADKLVDSNIVRIARIFISAGVATLLTHYNWKDEQGRKVLSTINVATYLFFNLTRSALQEYSKNPLIACFSLESGFQAGVALTNFVRG